MSEGNKRGKKVKGIKKKKNDSKSQKTGEGRGSNQWNSAYLLDTEMGSKAEEDGQRGGALVYFSHGSLGRDSCAKALFPGEDW